MYVRLKLSTTVMFHSPADMDDVLRKRVAWTSIGAEACNLLPTEPSRTTARSNPDLYACIPTEISWDVRRNVRLLVKLLCEMLHWRMREGRVCADFTYSQGHDSLIIWAVKQCCILLKQPQLKFTFFWCFLALFMPTFGPLVTVWCSVFVVRRHETN